MGADLGLPGSDQDTLPCTNSCDTCYSIGLRAYIYDDAYFSVDHKEVSKFICGNLWTIGLQSITDFVNVFSRVNDGYKLFYRKAKNLVTHKSHEWTTLRLIAAGILTCAIESTTEDEVTKNVTNVSVGYDLQACTTICAIPASWEHIKLLQ